MGWNEFILNEQQKDYYKHLDECVKNAYSNSTCYPEYHNIFRAFKLTPVENLKVVILGQDPYHEPDQAHGLAFSVLCKKNPPSLVNIYKEMESDLNVKLNQDGNLEYLAKQGVLLLNTILSVEEGKPLSHKNFGWETFTDNVIKYINTIEQPIAYILWGANAISKKKMITNPKHFVFTSAHPSPLSSYRGFFGSKPFSTVNEFLQINNLEPINWVNA
jgi:uracil-DNA glycosylase